MFWEALGSAVLGLVLALAAVRWLPSRLPDRVLVLGTGTAAALLGGVITRIVLGTGHSLVTLSVAAAVSAAILSLLLGNVRPPVTFRPEVAPRPRVP
ncbi:hypothetical protein [Streptomyces sp. Z26]|uniref:hypothetical protein n=1 Tax=Streptomyces TaxID=1883 RepID=UPI000EF1699F|nr:hypothetical protein [Streptomyces sp. Z26]RLL68779.1 hypothetical protein D7M15_20260 [Streptomyces sp. Z26]